MIADTVPARLHPVAQHTRSRLLTARARKTLPTSRIPRPLVSHKTRRQPRAVRREAKAALIPLATPVTVTTTSEMVPLGEIDRRKRQDVRVISWPQSTTMEDIQIYVRMFVILARSSRKLLRGPDLQLGSKINSNLLNSEFIGVGSSRREKLAGHIFVRSHGRCSPPALDEWTRYCLASETEFGQCHE